jgi:hypothetical protein
MAVSVLKPRQPVQEYAVMINRLGEQLQLMTIEEATRLSYGESQRDSHKTERPSIWAWQTVEGVLSGEVSDDAVSRMARSSKNR